MTYEQIKNRKHFEQLVKNFQNQRHNIKSAIIANKIGEETVTADILKSAAPVVEAIKQQQTHLQAPVQQSLVQPVELLAIDSDEQAGSNIAESQKILSDVMATAQLVPTKFELNVGTGKIGTSGMIDTNKLINEDKIIFSSDNGKFQTEIPKTTGLLLLLLAPFKFIKTNNLRDNVITKEDELIYAKIMHKAGMDPNSLKTSTKYKTIIKGVDTSPGLGMTGHGVRSAKHTHKLSPDGTFGALYIDVSLLHNSNQLKANKNGKTVLNRKITDDLVDILTKRYNSKKLYSDDTLKTYKKLLQLAGLSLPDHSKKLKAIKVGCQKIYYENRKELAKRLHILLGEIDAGNNNADIKNEAMEIIDILLKHEEIDKNQHKQLYSEILHDK